MAGAARTMARGPCQLLRLEGTPTPNDRNTVTVRITVVLALFSLMFGFVALNWNEFLAPSTLSVGFGIVQAPIGLIMLAVLLLFVGIAVVYVLYLHASELMRTRRLLKDMEAQRKLADQAETSRLTELRSFIGDHFAALRQVDADTLAGINAKYDASTAATRRLVEETTNSLSAQLGQLEDRLARLLPPSSHPGA